MRAIVSPVLIIVAAVMVGFLVVESCKTLAGNPSSWGPRPHECPSCNGQNVVDSDMLWWTCKWCAKSHAPDVGLLDENRPAGK